MFLSGKQDVQQEKINDLPARNLIYLQEDLISRGCLVDSGASVSIFPHHGPAPKLNSPSSASRQLMVPMYHEMEKD